MSGRLAGRVPVLAVAGLLGGVLYLSLSGSGEELLPLRLVAKALPVICLLVWLRVPHERYPRWISVGLGLSLAGDLLLDLGLFLPGLGAFLFAHLAYVAAYLTVTSTPSLSRAAPFALLGVGATLFLWPGLGSLALPVTAYVAVICTMLWRSAAMMGESGLARREQWAALAGALMFALSDGLLAIQLFVQPLVGASYAIMLLYWTGQLGIALSTRAAQPGVAFAPRAS